MKNSTIVKEIVLGLVLACLVVVEASYPAPSRAGSYSPYDSHRNRYGENNAPAYEPSAYSALPYSAKPAHLSPHGPYHSYAAKPAIYGGHKLYHYVGYTRHHPPPPLSGYRKNHPKPQHVLKPVKAVALILAPAYPGYPAHPKYPVRHPRNLNKYPKLPVSAYPPPADYPRTPYQARPYPDHPLESAERYPRSSERYHKHASPYRSYGYPGKTHNNFDNNNGYNTYHNDGAPRYASGYEKAGKSNSYKAYSTAY